MRCESRPGRCLRRPAPHRPDPPPAPGRRRGAEPGRDAARRFEIGRAHVCTPVTNAHIVCRLLLEKKKKTAYHPSLLIHSLHSLTHNLTTHSTYDTTLTIICKT